MPPNATQLVAACLALVLVAFVVGLMMLFTPARKMREKRIPMQSTATSIKMAARFENVQAADNFRNLFEMPLLFYALVAVALATAHTPGWLVAGA